MKKIYFLLFAIFFTFVANAQNFGILLPSQQEPYQQLISYAKEVKNILLEERKPIGKYHCNDIFSTDSYTVISDYICEAIVHSNEGPFVVKYKGIDDATNALIATALSNDSQKQDIYYNNGRFRFSIVQDNETSIEE